jgi:phosphatidylglycerophosphate synthase
MEKPNYQYVCTDKSVLYPHLKKWVWAPALPALPAWLSPNTMTLWGNFFAWVGFAVCLVLQPTDSTWFVVPALCTFLYLSFDNMDGMQARRAGRSSPLGEFLDHWGDSFNTGLAIFGYGVAMQTPPWFLALMLSLVCVAYFSCFWEQKVTGRLTFGPAGSVEGLMYIVTMYLLVAAFGHETICTKPVLGPLSVSNLCLLFVCGAFVLTIVGAWHRVGRNIGDFLGHAIAYAMLGLWFALGDLPFVAYGFMVVFANAHLGGRVVIARVLDEPFRIGDTTLYFLIAASMALSLGADLGADGQTLATAPVLAYLVYRLAADFSRTVSSLRHHLVESEFLAKLFPRM